jgi:hypothetical protein
MSEHRDAGWNLWGRNLIAAAMADERKVLLESVADAIGRAIAAERQREFQARAKLEIAITDLETRVSEMAKSIVAMTEIQARAAAADNAADTPPVRH